LRAHGHPEQAGGVATPEEITRHSDGGPDEPIFVGAPPGAEWVAIVDPDPGWAALYARLAGEIRGALGERVLGIEHVGSTSVAGLPAKPVIDITMTVADSADEAAYLPELERLGYVLRVREPNWHEHRCLHLPQPRVNLHVFGSDDAELVRQVMFRDWLREHPADRELYAAAKRSAAAVSNAAGETMMGYNQRKQAVVREILDRIFRANGLLDPSP
jgi:GrpB-like predicted nucleotidyltransferase (UPF0157 family)